MRFRARAPERARTGAANGATAPVAAASSITKQRAFGLVRFRNDNIDGF